MILNAKTYKDDAKTPWPWKFIAIATIFAVMTGGLLYYLTSSYVLGQAEKRIQSVLLSHKGIHNYIQRNTHPALYSLKELGELKDSFYSPELLSSSYMVRNVHKYNNEERIQSGLPEIYYKMAAINPRNPVNQADLKEAELIKMFNKNRNIKNYRDILELDGKKYLYYALPFLENTEACLKCHSDRQTAPVQLQAIYKGKGGFGETCGEIRAIESIRTPLEREFKTVYMIFAICLSGLGTLMVMLFISRNLKKTVKLRTADLEQEIAERKRTEEKLKKKKQELRNHRDHLEDLVKDRTTALEAKNKELETFTYSVSHDLKAPLRGIDGYSRLLLEEYKETLDEEGQRFLKNVRTSAEQMNQLIEDLLAYSRMERRDLQIIPIDLIAMLDALILEREQELTHRNIKVDNRLPFQKIMGDRESLRQILDNLIDNAVKFTRDEPVARIEINGKETPEHWTLEVKDNGAGFNPTYQDRIFTIFQRLHRAEDFPGTGVGLAIAQKGIRRMGGRIWAESEPGKGAVFYIEVPKSNKQVKR